VDLTQIEEIKRGKTIDHQTLTDKTSGLMGLACSLLGMRKYSGRVE